MATAPVDDHRDASHRICGCRNDETCASHAMQGFIRNFLLAFNVRAGIAVLGRVIRILRSSYVAPHCRPYYFCMTARVLCVDHGVH